MNEDLIKTLDKCNVSFTTQYITEFNKEIKVCSGGGLAHFLDDLRSANTIDRMILLIDNYIKEENMFDSLHSDGAYLAIFYSSIVEIYGAFPDDDPSLVLQSIDILEFKIILLAWKNFLESKTF